MLRISCAFGELAGACAPRSTSPTVVRARLEVPRRPAAGEGTAVVVRARHYQAEMIRRVVAKAVHLLVVAAQVVACGVERARAAASGAHAAPGRCNRRTRSDRRRPGAERCGDTRGVATRAECGHPHATAAGHSICSFHESGGSPGQSGGWRCESGGSCARSGGWLR